MVDVIVFFSVHKKKRLRNIIQIIRNGAPDVITLQEVWTQSSVRALKGALPEWSCFASSGRYFNSSGLVTFVRGRVDSFSSQRFQLLEGLGFAEARSGKGYHMLEMEIFNTRFVLLNTHLYNADTPLDRKVTKKQFSTLRKIVKQHDHVILSGDLNLSEKIFAKVNRGLLQYDDNEELQSFPRSKYQNYRLNVREIYHGRVDYTLIRSALPLEIVTRRIIEPVVSDHFPELTTITL